MTPDSLEAILAEEKAAEAAIDVDAMDDAQFEEFKGKLGSEEPAPEVTEETKPEASVETTDEIDPDEPTSDGKKRETVPHGQWHRERERRKAAEQQAQTATAAATKAMERLQALMDAQRGPAPEEEPAGPQMPAQDDFVGKINWTMERLQAMEKAATERSAQVQQANQQREAFNQLAEKVNGDYQQAIKTDPTVTEAHNALRQSVASEMEAFGYSQREIAEYITKTENQHLIHIAQNGLEVGDYIKNWAKSRGWAPKAANDPDPKGEAEKIAKREETRLASQSLGKSGGAVVNTGEMTPEQLLDMSDEEFDAYKKKYGSVGRAFARAS